MNKNKVYLEKYNTTVSITNKLSHINKRFYYLLLKLINLKLLNIENENERYNTNTFIFEIEELLTLLKGNVKKISNLKNKLKSIQLNLVELEEKEKYISLNLLSEFVIFDTKIKIEIPLAIANNLISNNYNVLINTIINKGLWNIYSIYIYEIFKNLKLNESIKYEVNEFKQLMFIGDNKYSSFSGLNQRVIAPLLVELRPFFNIEYEAITENYKTKYVAFKKI